MHCPWKDTHISLDVLYLHSRCCCILAGLFKKGWGNIESCDLASAFGKPVGNTPMSAGKVKHGHPRSYVQQMPYQVDLSFSALGCQCRTIEVQVISHIEDSLNVKLRIPHGVLPFESK